jgi:DNA-binding GntR family transcriptional regulator
MNDAGNATSQVYAALEADILSGRLKPRQRLVERRLEKELGVSRTPIREALRRLQYAGMVQADGARGVVVRDVDVAEVFNLFAVRLPLEKLAIETMAPVTAVDRRRLNAILDALDHAFDEHDFPRMIALNTQFHHAMAALTENDWLVRTLEQIRRQCYLIVQHGPVAEREGQKVSLADHRRMVQLLVRGDRDALTALTFEHVLRSALFFMRRRAIFDQTSEARANALKALAEHLEHVPALVLPSIPKVPAPRPESRRDSTRVAPAKAEWMRLAGVALGKR